MHARSDAHACLVVYIVALDGFHFLFFPIKSGHVGKPFLSAMVRPFSPTCPPVRRSLLWTLFLANVAKYSARSEVNAELHSTRFARLALADDAAVPDGLATSSCEALLRSYQALDCPFAAAEPSGGPPRAMPEELVESYTMGGKIRVADFFVDDTNSSQVRHARWAIVRF